MSSICERSPSVWIGLAFGAESMYMRVLFIVYLSCIFSECQPFGMCVCVCDFVCHSAIVCVSKLSKSCMDAMAYENGRINARRCGALLYH